MRRLLPVLACLALAAALVPAVFRWEQVLFQRDLLDFFLPMKAAFARAVRQGDWPWWDPFTYGGQPFFATLQSQVLYPPNWLFAALPLAGGMSLFVVLHLAWAGLGARALARELGAAEGAAWIAAVAFEAGGFLVSLVDLTNQLCAQAWLPWTCWCACRFAARPSARAVAGWAACCAAAFLGGEPQYAALGGVASMLLAVARARETRSTSARRVVLAAAAAALLGVLACAVQLVPLLELTRASERAGDADFAEGGRLALEPARLVALVTAPASAFGGPAGPYIESLHVGVVVVLLAVLGAASRRPSVMTLTAITIGSVLLAMGTHVPLLGELQLRVAPFFRYPIKEFCLAALAVPLLAAMGATRLRERLIARPRTARAVTGALIACITLATWHAQRVLAPSLPARELLAPTPLVSWLARETSPDGPRVHATPLTRERLDRRARRVLAGDLAGAMRERVELLEGGLPMVFGVSATWGGSALAPARQVAALQRAQGPLTPGQARELRASWLMDDGSRSLPLPPVAAGDGGIATLYRLDGYAPTDSPRRWEGPNVAVGPPGLPAPSDWPGWREVAPGRWRFRPTGLVPLSIVSALTWAALAAMALRRPRAAPSIASATADGSRDRRDAG